ncbi:putative F-box protein At4g21240 [Papaver somniferum]|uniref:putative F-box protein At4g21240 n=1 Tax=Papaver somniferum TaxID=3469 RepID=UPI000E7017E9|nr:putative F-box protein At4g21240 [Papaver somniferum]
MEKDGITDLLMDYFKFLPLEMKLDILTRLPTELVLNCKSICTYWRNVVGHPSFIRMHFHHHLNHPAAVSGKLDFLVLSESGRLHYFEYDDDQSTTPIQRIKRINFPFALKHFRFIGSINGLVCLLERAYNSPQSVWIWNPITRECVMLPEIKKHSDNDGYWYEETSFGYVPSTKEYKVVGFYVSKTHFEVHIYTLGSGNGWRNIGKFNYGSTTVTKGGGVLCKSDVILTDSDDHIKICDTKTPTSKSLVNFNSYIQVSPHKNTLVSLKELGEEDAKVMESDKTEEMKRREKQQEDADPEYMYL